MAADVKMDSVHEHVAEQFKMQFIQYEDPHLGSVIRASCVLDGKQYSFEEPVEKTFGEIHGPRIAKERCVRAILDNRLKEKGLI